MKTEKQTNEVLAKLDRFSYVFLACGFLALGFFLALVYFGISTKYDENNRILPAMAGLALGISIGLQIAKTYFKSLIVN